MRVQAVNADPALSAVRTPGSSPVRESPGNIAASVIVSSEAAAIADGVQDPQAVRTAVAAINRAAKSLTNTVQLVMDERSERPIVRVMDSETGQLIRQIPSEEVLELRQALDRISGLLINRTA